MLVREGTGVNGEAIEALELLVCVRIRARLCMYVPHLKQPPWLMEPQRESQLM